MSNSSHSSVDKITFAGLMVTLGIIYGDIGTSPLYVMKSIIAGSLISKELVFGGISCVFWTLTLQTTLKYVLITLKADNNGEGGIFSLYALVKDKKEWLITIAMIGGAALLADGVITPPISVSSAIEGLRFINPEIKTVPIVITIIIIIFFFQRFGTTVVGKFFGPVMLIWFAMLGTLGVNQIVQNPQVLAALNPYYAYNLLVNIPNGFWLLGAVFLCTTGAEALYSDLGHCGRRNIEMSWIFVKTCLVLNYLGQGAWLIQHEGEYLKENPFYTVMPSWFLIIGIGIATLAAIIASQALISGSFTLVGEAIRLHLCPKLKVNYPSVFKGQIYIPMINSMLCIGCIGVVLYFQESSNMEAAYGLAITVTMLMTTILLSQYLLMKGIKPIFVFLLSLLYFLIEGSFLVANLIKFSHGGYISVLISGVFIFVMYVCLRAYYIKFRHTEMVKVKHFAKQLNELSTDESIPKYATHLVFMSNAIKDDEIERKILYSIFQKRPKRADIYWFVHIFVTDEPYTMEYDVHNLLTDDVVRINFRLGFRVEQRVNQFLRQVVEDMIKNKEIDITSRYNSLRERNVAGDFRFVIVEEHLSTDNDLPFKDQFVMNTYIQLKQLTSSPEKWFGLDTSSVKIEKIPLLIKPAPRANLVRIS